MSHCVQGSWAHRKLNATAVSCMDAQVSWVHLQSITHKEAMSFRKLSSAIGGVTLSANIDMDWPVCTSTDCRQLPRSARSCYSMGHALCYTKGVQHGSQMCALCWNQVPGPTVCQTQHSWLYSTTFHTSVTLVQKWRQSSVHVPFPRPKLPWCASNLDCTAQEQVFRRQAAVL